jgi:hypothetical protein
VIEDAEKIACCCPTPRQPLFRRNQLNSCLFVHPFLECQNFDGFLGMAKRHQALLYDRRRQDILQERQDAHVTVGVWIIFYVGSGLELKHMEKGKTELP